MASGNQPMAPDTTSDASPKRNVAELLAGMGDDAFSKVGERAYRIAQDAFPICRSITGDGVRQTLQLLETRLPGLETHEVATGTQVLDWTIPKEWNLRQAWVRGPDGNEILSSREHNLHVLSYCAPIHKKVSLDELQDHLFSLPDQPDLIPYRTSYWREHWAFCIQHERRQALKPGTYEVFVDSTLEPGHLTYGEFFLPGETDEEILLSAHICHPSLANDNLSGLTAATELMALLKETKRRYGYRLVLVPGTIGSITWLARNEDRLAKIRGGLVAANLGDSGAFNFKRSRKGATVLDRAVEKVLEDSGATFEVSDFVPFGYDERQYCSPGFDLAVGLLSRSPWGDFPEYHTSADDLDFIQPEHLALSVRRLLEVARILENDRTFRNLSPKGEPQLGRRGLYHHIGGGEEGRERQLALLWVLNQSDGACSLLDIAERSRMAFSKLLAAAEVLLQAELLEEITTAE